MIFILLFLYELVLFYMRLVLLKVLYVYLQLKEL